MADVQLGIFSSGTHPNHEPGSPLSPPAGATRLHSSASVGNFPHPAAQIGPGASRRGSVAEGPSWPSAVGVFPITAPAVLHPAPAEVKAAKTKDGANATRRPASPLLQTVPRLRLEGSPARAKDPLSPSAVPTPRVSVRGRSSLPWASATAPARFVRPATISVPSMGVANDAARAKNNGRPLGLRFQRSMSSPGDLAKGLFNVASATSCPSTAPITAELQIVSGDALLSPKTPRMARGMVRRVSKVLVHYPDRPSLSTSPEKARPLSRHSITLSDSPEKASLRKSGSLKRVTWADQEGAPADSGDPMSTETRTKLHSSYVLDNGAITFALHRSARLMDSLYDIRRVVRPTDAEGNAAGDAAGDGPKEHQDAGDGGTDGDSAPLSPTAQQFAEEQEAMLHGTLRNLADVEADLRYLEEMLDHGLVSIQGCGGARHATAVVSLRTLSVVRRKASLLHDVETRTAALKAVHARRDEVLKHVVGNTAPAPPELAGIKKFISSYTHTGDPAAANKSDFGSFAATFKLPAKHQALVGLREVADEIGEWWADACLNQAERGEGHRVLKRLFEVAIGTGVEKDHPKIVRATRIINDRLAARVLQDAQERQTIDTEAASRMEVPQVGPAAKAADLTEQEILAAIKDGVPAKDERLKEAERIVKELREVDGQRKRLAGRQKRLEAEAKAQAK